MGEALDPQIGHETLSGSSEPTQLAESSDDVSRNLYTAFLDTLPASLRRILEEAVCLEGEVDINLKGKQDVTFNPEDARLLTEEIRVEQFMTESEMPLDDLRKLLDEKYQDLDVILNKLPQACRMEDWVLAIRRFLDKLHDRGILSTKSASGHNIISYNDLTNSYFVNKDDKPLSGPATQFVVSKPADSDAKVIRTSPEEILQIIEKLIEFLNTNPFATVSSLVKLRKKEVQGILDALESQVKFTNKDS